jgi:hypothetical protein
MWDLALSQNVGYVVPDYRLTPRIATYVVHLPTGNRNNVAAPIAAPLRHSKPTHA